MAQVRLFLDAIGQEEAAAQRATLAIVRGAMADAEGFRQVWEALSGGE